MYSWQLKVLTELKFGGRKGSVVRTTFKDKLEIIAVVKKLLRLTSKFKLFRLTSKFRNESMLFGLSINISHGTAFPW